MSFDLKRFSFCTYAIWFGRPHKQLLSIVTECQVSISNTQPLSISNPSLFPFPLYFQPSLFPFRLFPTPLYFHPELSTGHFFGPDRAKRWPDATRECRQNVWPDPPPHIYYFSWIPLLSCQHGEQNIHFCIISRETVDNFYLQVLYNVSRRWKKRSWVVLLFKTGLEAICNCKSANIKVHSGFNLSRSKLWSLNSFYLARFKQTSQSARSDPMYTSSTLLQLYIRQSWTSSWISCPEPTKVSIRFLLTMMQYIQE